MRVRAFFAHAGTLKMKATKKARLTHDNSPFSTLLNQDLSGSTLRVKLVVVLRFFPMRVVILGGGFAGLACARQLANSKAEVTLIDQANHHLFQPLLYQVATAALSPAQIATPIRQVFRGARNLQVVMDEVLDVDRAHAEVVMRRGRVHYDVLVVATGARHSYFKNPEWEPLAPGLKTLADALKCRSKILTAFERAESSTDEFSRRNLTTFVFVGGGPTGVEMAGATAELAKNVLSQEFQRAHPERARIFLIEAGPRLLSAFPEELSNYTRHSLELLGVQVRTSTRVVDIGPTSIVVQAADRGELEKIFCQNVFWAAGTKASRASDWLRAPSDAQGRVKVTPALHLYDDPKIFVIGDTACVEDRGQMLPSLAPVALQQGEFIGRSLRRAANHQQPVALKTFKYKDKGILATIGRSKAVALVSGRQFTGFTAWILWSIVHIMYLVGFRNRLFVFLDWVHSYVTYSRGARLIDSEGSKQ
jgi:NADH dehydrogenase